MYKIFAGVISGIFTSLGMGGGAILIIILTIILNVEQKTAQQVNLIFFVCSSLISIILNLKEKRIKIREIYLVIIFGIIGTIIGTNIALKIDVKILRKAFGIFLLIMAIIETTSIFKEILNKRKI